MMKTITIPITLPEDVAERAEEKGLLNPASVVMLLRKALDAGTTPASEQGGYPPDFDPRLEKLVDPLLYGKGRILGDIVEPIDVAWEAEQ